MDRGLWSLCSALRVVLSFVNAQGATTVLSSSSVLKSLSIKYRGILGMKLSLPSPAEYEARKGGQRREDGEEGGMTIIGKSIVRHCEPGGRVIARAIRYYILYTKSGTWINVEGG